MSASGEFHLLTKGAIQRRTWLWISISYSSADKTSVAGCSQLPRYPPQGILINVNVILNYGIIVQWFCDSVQIFITDTDRTEQKEEKLMLRLSSTSLFLCFRITNIVGMYFCAKAYIADITEDNNLMIWL